MPAERTSVRKYKRPCASSSARDLSQETIARALGLPDSEAFAETETACEVEAMTDADWFGSCARLRSPSHRHFRNLRRLRALPLLH